jgi:hypothetical protein
MADYHHKSFLFYKVSINKICHLPKLYIGNHPNKASSSLLAHTDEAETIVANLP